MNTDSTDLFIIRVYLRPSVSKIL